MIGSVFINLPVTDVDRSRAFFEALGFSINDALSNDRGICVVI
ncbi:MAG: VOC family protein, partial [Agromyces sp.]